MGIVYEAIHESLGRRVAVKVLSSGLLGDKKHLARFRREARAAAKLRHTNIVPIFGVGQSDNHHYYVMDFVDGMSLRQLIESMSGQHVEPWPTIDQAGAVTDGDLQISQPDDQSEPTDSEANKLRTGDGTDYRWAAQIGATISDALQYAHSQGVLHRDIKPANLLIDRLGGVWIADFGLAKLTEQQMMTATGDILGTPQYMPPESFEGTYDERSEIYAVGLTLYELLTRRPAIDGKSPADIIRKATAGVVSRPRAHCPDLPRDLETIVLKCLSHAPEARYAAVGEVRDDLQRFLANRPISARRTGVIGRAIRWSRREPIVASLTLATFGLLVALASVSAIGYWRTKDALDVASSAQLSAERSLTEKTAALETAKQQRQRAEKNLQVALTAFDSIMTNISSRGLEAEAEFFGEVTDTTSPNVTPQDAKLLQSLLGFFDELGANNSEALDRYDTISRRSPHDIQVIITRAELQNELAVIAGLRGQLGRADQFYRTTVELLDRSEAAAESKEGKFEYGRAHRLFASIRVRSGLDAVGQRVRDRDGIRMRRPGGNRLRQRIEAELAATTTAIETFESLVKQFPDQIRFQVELARAYRDRAKVAATARQKRESESSIRKSIDLFETLLEQSDSSDAIKYELAVTLSSTEAVGINPVFRTMRAAELSEELLQNSPNQPRFLALRARTLTGLALFQGRNRNFDKAAQNLEAAIEIYNSLTARSPELSQYAAKRSQTLEAKSDLLQRQGNTEAAIATLELAIEGLEGEGRGPRTSPVVRFQMQRMKQKLARMNQGTERGS
jgi:serine/threonine protein kinase